MKKEQIKHNERKIKTKYETQFDTTSDINPNSISASNSDIGVKFNWLICLTLAFSFMILGFVLDTPNNLWSGIIRIVLSSSVLTTDYLAVGGIGAALIHNAGFILLLLAIILISKTQLTGKIMANIFMPLGFAFFGINVLNILPFILGVSLYAKRQKQPFSAYITTGFNLGALGPVVSVLAFDIGLPFYLSIPLAILCGAVIGFFMPSFAVSCSKLHQGYTLYNTGFTGGFIGILVFSLLSILKIEIIRPSLLVEQTSQPLIVFLITYSLLLIILGIAFLKKIGFYHSEKSYRQLLKFTGYREEIGESFGAGITYINMGIMGLLAISFVLLTRVTLTGPILAGVLSIMGYATIGKQPFNTIPIVLGVTLGGLTAGADLSSTGFVMIGLFSTALAPVAGEFGLISGITAGFIHYAIATISSSFHGGLLLYNNGFASGIVAILLVNILINLPQSIFRRNNTNS